MTAPSSIAQAPRLPDGPPLVAILRGLEPARAVEVGTLLHEAGFRIIEVPLNRPGAIESIEQLCRLNLPDTLIGAGTVLDAAQVDAVHQAGGRLVVMPHGDAAVITHACAREMVVAPGVFTATEAFAALKLGAGFGIGGALFQPGVASDELAQRARSFVAAWHAGRSA